MEIFSSDKMFSYKLGNSKNLKFVVTGDYKISYCEDTGIYLIARYDGLKIDGTESMDSYRYENGQAIKITDKSFERTLIVLIMIYTGMQDNERPFLEFNYEFDDDKRFIIIYPKYLDIIPNVTIKMNTKIDEEISDISLTFRTEKICLGPIEQSKKLDENTRTLTKKK